MKTFVKNYIGKGKQIEGLAIAKITCKLEDLQKFVYQYDGISYVTFEVAKMKTADNFGRDYTVYVSTKEEVEEQKNVVNEKKVPQNKTKKRTKKQDLTPTLPI